MIAAQEERLDAPAREPRELAVEEEADRGVPPVAVEDVAGDHDEGGLELERLRHEVLEGLAACASKARGDIAILLGQPKERAAEVQIGGVDNGKRMAGMINPFVVRTKSEPRAIQRKFVGPAGAS